MANYRNGGYDKTARTWIGIIAVVLAVVIAGAIALGVVTEGFTDWSKFQPDKQEEQTEEGSNENLLVDANGTDRMRLNVVRAAAGETSAEESITVTATITPATATNKMINWSLAFENSTSEWATGKDPTDYVTVTPTDEYRNEVRLDCTEAFGEVIILTATTAENAEITATCELNYMARYDKTQGIVLEATGAEADIEIPYIDGDQSASGGTGHFSLPFMNGETYTAKAGGYGVGTMQDDLTVSITSEYYKSGTNTPVYKFLLNHYGSDVGMTSLKPVALDSSIVFDQDLLNGIFGNCAESNYSSLFSAVAQQAYVSGTGYKNYILLKVTVSGEYSGDITYAAYGYIQPGDMGVQVSDVTLNTGTVIF